MVRMSTLSELSALLSNLPAYPQRLEASALPGELRANPLVVELLAMTPEQERAFAERSDRESAEDEQVMAEVLASPR